MGKMRAFLLAAILLATIVIAHQGPAGLSASTVTGVAQPPAPFTGYTDLPGVRLWYSDTGGSGTPLVLLHANTGNADSWTPNIPGLAAAGYRLIAFDRRGWGRSVADPDTGAQPGTIAGDLDALADHLGLDRFHLVGIAGGGFAAYDYVLSHPERLRSLVIACSGGGIDDPELAELRARTQLPGFA